MSNINTSMGKTEIMRGDVEIENFAGGYHFWKYRYLKSTNILHKPFQNDVLKVLKELLANCSDYTTFGMSPRRLNQGWIGNGSYLLSINTRYRDKCKKQ